LAVESHWQTLPLTSLVQAAATLAAAQVLFTAHPPPLLVVHPVKYAAQLDSVVRSVGAVEQVLTVQKAAAVAVAATH
jgi:hypothetical protein